MLWRSLVQRLLPAQAVLKLLHGSGGPRGPKDYELPKNAANTVKSCVAQVQLAESSVVGGFKRT